MKFKGLKVFSATMLHQRDQLGEQVTAWIAAHPELEVVDVQIRQSSDHSFHCISITVFYDDAPAEVTLATKQPLTDEDVAAMKKALKPTRVPGAGRRADS